MNKAGSTHISFFLHFSHNHSPLPLATTHFLPSAASSQAAAKVAGTRCNQTVSVEPSAWIHTISKYPQHCTTNLHTFSRGPNGIIVSTVGRDPVYTNPIYAVKIFGIVNLIIFGWGPIVWPLVRAQICRRQSPLLRLNDFTYSPNVLAVNASASVADGGKSDVRPWSTLTYG
jgi:hypothetical protein